MYKIKTEAGSQENDHDEFGPDSHPARRHLPGTVTGSMVVPIEP
jgi:hypothetical protein